MRKPPTGEPCAGEPHARFGGRGRRKPFPTPIKPCVRLIFRVDLGLPVIGAGLFSQLGLLLFNSVFASSSTNFTNPE